MESRAPAIKSAMRVAGLLLVAAWAGQSGAQETEARSGPHPFAGWWLAIDDLWPRLRHDAGAAVFEELLIVHDDGTVENRAVFFQLPGEEACLSGSAQPCSDAPLIAAARLLLDDGILGFEERRDGSAPLFGSDAEVDRRLRGDAITGLESWIVIVQGNGGEITLISSDGRMARNFIRISPDWLRRLRAGIIVASVSAADHWHCYIDRVLGRADAIDGGISDQLVEDYLHIASYALSLLAASRSWDAAASSDGSQVWMMIEAFDDVQAPRSDAEGAELDARLAALASGHEADSANLPFTAAERANFSTILSQGEETGRLFCLK